MSVLKTCPYCGGHGYINQFEDVEGGCRAWANECIACKGTGAILVPETNADRIRRMSGVVVAGCCAEPGKVDEAPGWEGDRELDKILGLKYLRKGLQKPAEEDA